MLCLRFFENKHIYSKGHHTKGLQMLAPSPDLVEVASWYLLPAQSAPETMYMKAERVQHPAMETGPGGMWVLPMRGKAALPQGSHLDFATLAV